MDFRRWFIALSVLALMAGLATAQIGTYTAPGSVAGALGCTANAASTPQLRAEGYTELAGDILITCTGGAPPAVGSLVPTTNITVYVQPSLNVTSRLMSTTTQASEALLLIDDPGSTLPTGPIGGWGPKAPQIPCAQLTTGGCTTYAGTAADGVGTLYYVASSSATAPYTPAANVYQGVLNQLGPNTITFYGVPVLPPVTSGISRTYRVTNVRVPTVGLGSQQGISAFISTNPSTILPITQSNLSVGIVAQGLATVAPVITQVFAQCDTTKNGAYQSAYLTYSEGFATAFKTRVVPLSATTYAAESTNNGIAPSALIQNIPGGLYPGFSQNSESGLIQPLVTSSKGYTAGLADFGTRLKAVFTNIPAGVTLYVSVTNVAGTSIAAAPSAGLGGIGGQDVSHPYAVLVGTISGDANSDSTTFAPILAGASGTVDGHLGNATYTNGAYPLTPNASGVAAAVWEVTNSNNGTLETLQFAVFIGYVPVGATTANPYGLPQITNFPGGTTNNVSQSFAPEPGGGSFAASAGPVAGTNIIPRFNILNPQNGQWVTINLCETTLLYPYVTANPTGSALGQGFDTGIVVSNTSTDPFNVKVGGAVPFGVNIPAGGAAAGTTLQQAGSCQLFPYGVQVSATGTTSPWPNGAIKGCDFTTNPSPGVNCFPVVNSGTVQSVLASQMFPGFQGYLIAVCNFQYAHGYAAVTDLGLRGLFSSYLALELNPCGGYCTNPRGAGIENLVH